MKKQLRSTHATSRTRAIRRRIGLTALAAALGLSATVLADDPSPVAAFDMASVTGSTVADASGNGHNLTLSGNISVVNDPDFGPALNCPGDRNDYASFQCPALTERTVAGWFLWAADNGDHTGSNPYFFNGISGMGMNWYQLQRQFSVLRGSDTVAQSGKDITRGIWHHIAFTVTDASPAQVTIYVDGRQVASASKSITWVDGVSTAYLGNINNSTGRPFKGRIADFRVYGSALTAEQIARLYSGPASVSAGADFTVCGERATLRGTVGANAGNGFAAGYAGAAAWSLVSAPPGGEGAAIHNPAAAATTVDLPVPGAYVFRLAVSDLGASRSDDVTVTRVAELAANAAPSVSISAPAAATTAGGAALAATVSDDGLPAPASCRVWWSVKSGPGGAWFDPQDAASTRVSFGAPGAYVLSCTADDGARRSTADVAITATGDIDGSTLTNGLGRSWSMDGLDSNWGRNNADDPWESIAQRSGVEGLATAFNGHKPFVGTGVTAFPGEEGGANNTASTLPFLTVSAWVYVDPASTNNWFGATVVGKHQTFGLRYKEKAYGTWGDQQQGFTIYQQGAGGSTTLFHYPAPTPAPEGRWMHLCAVVDRAAGTAMELWYDGVQQTASSSSGGAAGRYNASPITIGGMPYSTVAAGSTGATGYNDYNVFYPSTAHNSATVVGQEYSRTFPGAIDEVKIWNRKLSGAEIRYLASHPDMGADRGASVQAPSVPNHAAQGRFPVAAVAFADTLPTGASLTYRWEEISGRSTDVAFDDATAASTTATFAKSGTYVLQLSVSDGVRTVHSLPCEISPPEGTVIYMR